MTATQECIDQKKTNHFNDLFHTYFHKNLFFIRNDLTNKEEVIRFMGQQFIDQDITSDGFIKSVLQHQKNHVLCPIKPKRNPMGYRINDCRTNKDRNEFMELYEAILHSLDSPDKIQQLLHSHTFDDFVKHLMVQE